MFQPPMGSTNSPPLFFHTLLKPNQRCPQWKPIAMSSLENRGSILQISRSSRGWWWALPKAETKPESTAGSLEECAELLQVAGRVCAPKCSVRVCAPLTHTHWKQVKLPSAFLTSEMETINTCLNSWLQLYFLNPRSQEAEDGSIWGTY